jgi:hypothetical protein
LNSIRKQFSKLVERLPHREFCGAIYADERATKRGCPKCEIIALLPELAALERLTLTPEEAGFILLRIADRDECHLCGGEDYNCEGCKAHDLLKGKLKVLASVPPETSLESAKSADEPETP